MDQFEKLRPVGRLEKYSTARHQVGFYLNLAVAATYTLPKEYTLTIKDYVFKACAAVIEEHPILSAIPAADDTQEPYFVRLPTIDLNQVVQFTQRQQKSSNSTLTGDNDLNPDLDLQAVLQSEHNKPFAAPNPFWRLHVLLDKEDNSRFTVALILHHALGDGTSAKSFHLSFLCALRSTSDGEISHTVMTPQVPLLPNIEDIHPMSLSFWFLAKKIFQAKIYSPRDPGLWTGSKILLPTSTRIRLVPFSKKLVGQLRSACRQESTTITALLQTVYARALFKNIPESFTRLNCTGAFSTRRFLPDIITEGSMGVFVADIEESYTRSTVLPRDSIAFPGKKHAARGRLFKPRWTARKELCLSKVGEDRDKSFEVSNIGAVVFTEDPNLPCIQDMAFSQCASVMGNAIGVSVVTGGDGCLVLSLTWQEGVVEDDIMDASIETMKEELRSLSVGK
ncbi:hypothetical protein N7450_001593 [Penicillium hetheringtonii]|uniref:Alcohol acetyltransferase n=1 Tax=Penicillium hetheringtonii TaxID=911720 RepID=A0AAD6H2U0_9EURO|nr:hypothetical protein N7450_001593 [Penicillium hetheringtonii]